MSGEFFDKAGDLILRLWERGQNFLWAVATVGAAVFVILSTGWWFGLGNGPDLFKTYGFPALIVAVGGVIFGVWRKLDDRPKPTVYLIADEGQSFWGQSRQPDGRVSAMYPSTTSRGSQKGYRLSLGSCSRITIGGDIEPRGCQLVAKPVFHRCPTKRKTPPTF
jgi:hypothetical protein